MSNHFDYNSFKKNTKFTEDEIKKIENELSSLAKNLPEYTQKINDINRAIARKLLPGPNDYIPPPTRQQTYSDEYYIRNKNYCIIL